MDKNISQKIESGAGMNIGIMSGKVGLPDFSGRAFPLLRSPPRRCGSVGNGCRSAAAVIEEAKKRQNDFVLDYEHQSLAGGAAPAAGWFSFRDIEYVPGDGMYIQASLTGKAANYIINDEYRYASAVFTYHPQSGLVEKLYSVALTNTPGIDENTTGLKEQPVTPSKTEQVSAAEVTGKPPVKEKTEPQSAALKTEAEQPLSDGPAGQPVQAKENDAAYAQKSALFNHALEQMKVIPAQRTVLMKLSTDDLRDYLNTLRPISFLKGRQTEGREQLTAGMLNTHEREVCLRLGIPETEFLTAKNQHI
ncbi:hypothetical protein CHS0354_018427 [Potamilus streckersoni]|uniref:Mu-like prophage I protein n=1 Tax=Potamilus streckersoni TaxID=2493646 RepID=A0AAE0TBQ5_9BIVA|nr:hypothetical protein CHS0354_018427 [Potamilus streckersoni]